MSDTCQHFKFGFCRYTDHCFKKHIKEVCDKKNCDVKQCVLRHPKKCSYFEQFKYCKFGDFCCYRHDLSNDEKVKVDVLENLLKEKCLIIDTLKTKMTSLERRISLLENEKGSDNLFTTNLDTLNLCVISEKDETVNNTVESDTLENADDNRFNLDKSEGFETHGKIPQLDGLHEQSRLVHRSMSTNMQFEFKCDKCNFSSSHEDHLRRHKQKKHKQKR